jgi:hypothetical protein
MKILRREILLKGYHRLVSAKLACNHSTHINQVNPPKITLSALKEAL